jgi:hypothetical protein
MYEYHLIEVHIAMNISWRPRQKVHSMLHIYYAATDEQVQIDLGHIHKVANITTSGPKYRVQIE